MIIVIGFSIPLIALLIFVWSLASYAIPAVESGPLDHMYNLTLGNQSYPIRYGFTEGNSAMVENIYSNYPSKSITVIINDDNLTATDWEKRVFSIELPRNIVNANTTEIAGGCRFFVPGNNTVFWAQEHDIEYDVVVNTLSKDNTANIYKGHWKQELCGRDTRTVSFDYSTGKSMTVIQGTVMIPEFGMSSVILSIVVVSMISGCLAMQRCLHFEAK